MPVLEDEPMTTETDVSTTFLTENVVLMSPTLSVWRGHIQLPKGAEVNVGGRIVTEAVTTPRVKLMTDKFPVDADNKPWKARFDTITARISALKNRFSVGFAVNGVRIIPKSAVSSFMGQLFGQTIGSLKYQLARGEDGLMSSYELGRLRERLGAATPIERLGDATPVYDPLKTEQSVAYCFWEAVNAFTADYASIMQQLEAKCPCWDAIRARIPQTTAAMRGKFNLSVTPMELATDTAGQPTVLSLGDLNEHADVIRQACTEQVELAIASMIREPREELARTLENVENLISRNGRVTARTFETVRRALEKLEDFKFVATDRLLQQMAEVKTLLNNVAPADLRAVDGTIPRIAETFRSQIGQIRAEVSSAEEMERTMQQLNGGRPSRAMLFMDNDDVES